MRRVGLLAVIVISWGYISILRIDGIDGGMRPTAHLRWTPTAEELYLAEKSPISPPAAQPADEPLALGAGDWPGFRGPGFLGEQEHTPIATNWNEVAAQATLEAAGGAGLVIVRSDRRPHFHAGAARTR